MKIDKKRVHAARPLARFLQSLSHEDFVLHGSLHRFTTAEPRQAQGNPMVAHQCLFALYATIAVEFALIHALIREPSYRIDHEKELLVVRGDSIVVERGFIYVLPSKGFVPIDGSEEGIWRTSNQPVETLAAVEVGAEILPHFPFIAFQCDEIQEKA